MGISLGGFFDGILLHQVLQWHHLLSLVENPAVQDIRTQILADGLFHVLMYFVATLGLVFLWKSRYEFSETGAGKWLLGTMLLGFGLWNVADVVLFHWLLQIHRIRVDVPNPLFWDVLWLCLFGLVFMLVGWLLRSRSDTEGGTGINRENFTAAAIAAFVITAGALAAQPPSDSGTTMVMFKADAKPAQVFQAFDAAKARILWSDRSGKVWAVNLANKSETVQLYRHGAILATNSMIGLGCLSWLRT